MRRGRGPWWALALGVALSCAGSPLVRTAPPRPARVEAGVSPVEVAARVQRVAAVAVTVSDLDRSVRFYCDVLDFTPGEEVELAGAEVERLLGVASARLRVAPVRLGEQTLLLVDFLTPEGRPIPPDARSNDLSFQHVAIVVRDMDTAYVRVAEAGVAPISPGPQRLPDWNPAAGGIRAFYFRDPDGHVLELIQFPPGKGDPRWQRPTDRLFLGIDHTAIAVSDTERSLGFYRDALGMQVVGTSENWGPEQERLNAVPGAHLRITSLRAGPTPGVELLEYLEPRGGRPAAPDTRSNDLVHWQVELVVPDATQAAARTQEAGGRLLTPGEVRIPQQLGFTQGVLVSDPDGHAVLLGEP